MNPTLQKIYDGFLAGIGIFLGWSLASFLLALLVEKLGK